MKKISNNQIKLPSKSALLLFSVLLSFSIIIFSCEGGPRAKITKYIKENLNDPDSFELRSFEENKEFTKHGCGKVYMVKYSGTNAFGGMITNEEFVIITSGGKTMFSKYSECLMSKILENY